MKVVINVCFGGFGLSHTAARKYLELQGEKAFFYRQTKHKYKDGEDEYRKVTGDSETALWTTTSTKDLGDVVSGEVLWGDGYKEHYFYDNNIKRSDPLLVRCVEELGEKANGDCAKLRVVEIPDGTSWEIDEYDGNEHIAETHRTWG